MEPFVNVAVQAARQAGDFIRRQQEQAPFLDIQTNASQGESTIVDIQAEQLIIQAIRKKFPKHNIISEEQGSLEQGSEVTWIIDPLDGTRNFIHGIPHFAVSIAIQIKNQVEHAVILDPIRHECFTASRGRGAQLNNRRLRVNQKNVVAKSLIAYGKHVALSSKSPETQHFMQQGLNHLSLRRMGCVSLDLAYVASSRMDAYFGIDMMPWDCAAGLLIIQEAGGIVCDFKGQAYTSFNPKEVLTGPIKLVKSIVDSWSLK